MATYLDYRSMSMFNIKIILKNTRKNFLFAFNLMKNKEIDILSDEDIINTNEKSDVLIDEGK